MKPWIVSISIAYLLGSIPFGYLLVRIFRKEDIREQGSGNIGATNVARSGAKGLGIATLLLDLGKAYAGVWIAAHVAAGLGNAGTYDVEVAAAVAAVVGHVFPVWLGFRGGKGVASALGVFLALTWPSGLAIFLVFLVVFAMTRYVSPASALRSFWSFREGCLALHSTWMRTKSGSCSSATTGICTPAMRSSAQIG